MRSRSVDAGAGGKYSSQSSFDVVTAAQAPTAPVAMTGAARRGEAEHGVVSRVPTPYT